jgi:Family of unknown function (DUF5643)/Domain of unknown function (DUF4179)
MRDEQLLEHQLTEEKEKILEVQVPADLDRAILLGMQKAQQIQTRRKRIWRYGAALTACTLIMGLVFSIRLSPVIAAYISHIPGMERIVDLIRDDKGLQQAAKHEMIQTVEASAQQGGVRLSVNEVLMDHRRMLIFYTITHEQPDHILNLDKVELLDASGEKWGSGHSWGSSDFDSDSSTKNRIEVYLTEKDVVPEQLQLQVTVEVDHTPLVTPLTVTFPIDKTKFAAHKEITYAVNQDVSVDGQRFTIEQITAYPTQTEVSIRFDPANSKQIFDFDQLALVDEKGNIYKFWGDGVPYTSDGEHRVIYNLESFYFTQPEQLYLQAERIRALDKEKRQVRIDAKTGRLLQAPDDRLLLDALRQNDVYVGIDFSLRVEEYEQNSYLFLFSELTDDLGNEYEHIQSSSTSNHEDEQIPEEYAKSFKRVSSKGEPSEYRFQLYSYPSRISEGFKIQIK